MPISQTVLDRLSKFDTPTICNIVELFDVCPRHTGYMDAHIVVFQDSDQPTVTATFGEGNLKLLREHQVESKAQMEKLPARVSRAKH
jgi:hypothetical protein